MTFVAFKGATSYEIQVGWFWVRLPYWRFIVYGVWPSCGIDTGEN